MSQRRAHSPLALRRLTLVVVAALLGLVLTARPAVAESPDDLLVIVNPSTGAASLSQAEIYSLFLRVRQAFPNSSKKVVPIHAKDGSTLRIEFQRRVLSMSPEQEGRYWQDQKVKAGIDKPVEFSNPQMAVFKLAGGIGYVFRRDYKPGATVVVATLPKN
jgi:hypothetical protein